ncbi:MAG: hypothetical protein H0X33_03875 [Taibaiella sp.]|nr:hypothetical protein [Taibaiella sp.]
MRLTNTVACMLALAGALFTNIAAAKIHADTALKVEPTPIKRFYIGNALDGGIFSTATMQRPGVSSSLGTLRFSYVLNIGVTFNYDLNSHFGVFTGVDIKNVGFIEKQGDSTVKHRTYNLGVPLGLRFGNIQSRNFFFIGADIEMPFNYKEKGFIKRSHKEKFNDWFSARTPTFMPAVFAGFSMKPGVIVKVEYYLTNFLNPDFTENGIKPYQGYKVNLLLLSIGADIHYRTSAIKKRMKVMKTA